MANVILIVPLLPLQGDNFLNCHWQPQKDAYSPRNRRWETSLIQNVCQQTTLRAHLNAVDDYCWRSSVLMGSPMSQETFHCPTTPLSLFRGESQKPNGNWKNEGRGKDLKWVWVFVSISVSPLSPIHSHTHTLVSSALFLFRKKNTSNTFKCTHMFVILLSLYLLKKKWIAPTPHI